MIAARADASAPPVPGFVESVFSPVVYQAARRCLADRPGDGARTAVVLASTMGDATTLDLGSRLLVGGRVHNPLLFMQSTANAILGQLSRDFAITGPLLSLSTMDDLAGELLATAQLLLEDEELDRVLLIGVELTGTDRTAAAYRELGTGPPAADLAVAIVLDRDDPLPSPPNDVPSTEYGSLRGLVELAARIRGTRT
ncbi:beta-ketoacyl synthase chain length factor [Amycolatopsis anabasis]|uniref:beta-ketoacyl synthase chain length factor n=1 Tax=Amycolatopsis anabasis TaxID=1840409 RepID=UPI00131E7974|nr:beta-ketoacyl synthase chain length factor [Amycolatopsis anabasis]